MPFIQIPGLHIHYEQAGEGTEILVLVHGNFASWRWWLPLLENLPTGYRAYAPDLRGCGDTEKPPNDHSIPQLAEDLAAFADALALPRFHLIGHSLGGAVSLQFALRQPQRLYSLALVASAPAEGLKLHKEHHFFSLSSLIPRDTLARWLPSIIMHRPVMQRSLSRALPTLSNDHDLEPLVEDALRLSSQAVTGFLQSLDQWNVQAELGKLQVPVLIVGGALDPVVSPEALARTAAALPNARLIIWEDTGHGPQLEQPQRFRALLEAFIRQPTAPAPEVVPPRVPVSKPGRLRRLWNWLRSFFRGSD